VTANLPEERRDVKSIKASERAVSKKFLGVQVYKGAMMICSAFGANHFDAFMGI